MNMLTEKNQGKPPSTCLDFHQRLKPESCLKFDGASGICAIGFTEIRVVDENAGTVKAELRQIQIIEKVEEISFQLDCRRLARRAETGQTESFGDAHIDGEIIRSAKRVAPDARSVLLKRRTEIVGQIAVRVVKRRLKITTAAAGEISVRAQKAAV